MKFYCAFAAVLAFVDANNEFPLNRRRHVQISYEQACNLVPRNPIVPATVSSPVATVTSSVTSEVGSTVSSQRNLQTYTPPSGPQKSGGGGGPSPGKSSGSKSGCTNCGGKSTTVYTPPSSGKKSSPGGGSPGKVSTVYPPPSKPGKVSCPGCGSPGKNSSKTVYTPPPARRRERNLQTYTPPSGPQKSGGGGGPSPAKSSGSKSGCTNCGGKSTTVYTPPSSGKKSSPGGGSPGKVSTVYPPPSKPGKVSCPGCGSPGKNSSKTVYTPPPARRRERNLQTYTPPSGPQKSGGGGGPSPAKSSGSKSGCTNCGGKSTTVYTPPSSGKKSSPGGSPGKVSTVYPPPSKLGKVSCPGCGSPGKNSSKTVYTPPPARRNLQTMAGRRLTSVDAEATIFEQQKPSVVSLNATLTKFGKYSLSPRFVGSASLAWPNHCFSATIEVTNFVPNCQGCSFAVADGGLECQPSELPSVKPFVHATKVTVNPYASLTFFDTDANGHAAVTIHEICTGFGPMDNNARPLVLLDSTGATAACGLLSYVCP